MDVIRCVYIIEGQQAQAKPLQVTIEASQFTDLYIRYYNGKILLCTVKVMKYQNGIS